MYQKIRTAPLDQRIASTLASDDVDKGELTALLAEAEQALVAAQETITTESERALDLANTEPDASDALVRKAERTVARGALNGADDPGCVKTRCLM